MPKATTFLTFQEKGEEAVRFYVSLFENSKIDSLVQGGEGGPMPKGALMHASFQIDGQHFMAMDGGPYFTFGQGFSILVNCETQEEIDRLWKALTEGGEEQPCGWLCDRYGVSWQIVPSILGTLMTDPDPEKAGRATQAMLRMKKFDIQALKNAYEGKE